MKTQLIYLPVIVALLAIAPAITSGQTATLTDDKIREIIIKNSIASYPGSCPCPYNRASNGSKCGKRSAYSLSGGYETMCYKQDVTEKMIKNYRKLLTN